MKKLIFICLIFPYQIYSNPPGERILRAAQNYGMTDSELNYFLDNTKPDLTLKDPVLKASALIHAALNNRPNMVKLLLEKGKFDINEVDKNGETSLIAAAKKGHLEVVKVLLEFNPDRNIKGASQKIAYQYAIEGGHTEIAELLKGPSTTKSFQKIGKLIIYLNRIKPTPSTNPVSQLKEIEKIVGIPEDINKKRLAREAVEKWQSIIKNRTKKENLAKLNKKIKDQGINVNITEGDLETNKKPKSDAKIPMANSPTTQAILTEDDLKAIILKLTGLKNQLMKAEEENLRLKQEKEKAEAAKERIREINSILFSGSNSKNPQEIAKEPVEVQNAKVEAIQSLLDTEEKPEEKNIQFKMATKRVMMINRFKNQPKVLAKEIQATEKDEQIQMNQSEKKIKMEEEKKKAEVDQQNSSELASIVMKSVYVYRFADNARKNKIKRALEKQQGGPSELYDLVMKTDNVNKFVTNLKMKKGQNEILPKWDSTKKDLMIFPDFKLKMLTKEDCFLKQNDNKKWLLFIYKLSFHDVAQSSRKAAIWFINKDAESPTTGKECPPGECSDFPIYSKSFFGSKEVTFNKITLYYGETPKDHFEIYSPGKKTVIRIPITDCEKYPKKPYHLPY